MTIEDVFQTEAELPVQPYLIAEIGVNHFDIADQREIPPLDAAKLMISEAATAGVDAVKFQAYSADTLATERAEAYWDTDEEEHDSQHELFSQYDSFGAEEFQELAAWIADNHSVDFLSTPFDSTAVEYLDAMVPAYKIASADITNHPLLRHVAQKGKPILLSTGASTIGEIDTALEIIRAESSVEVCLLHCILDYPTAKQDANLAMIEHLGQVYPNCIVGYSDHVPPDQSMITLLGAVVRGASVIEKHFTLDKELEGNDHYHAMGPDDVRRFRENVDIFRTTTGRRRKEPIDVEMDSREYARRSIVATTDIPAGEEIQRSNLAMKRPGTGISPELLDVVVGRTASSDIAADEILSWEMI